MKKTEKIVLMIFSGIGLLATAVVWLYGLVKFLATFNPPSIPMIFTGIGFLATVVVWMYGMVTFFITLNEMSIK